MKATSFLHILLLLGICCAVLNCKQRSEEQSESQGLTSSYTAPESPTSTPSQAEASETGTVKIFDIRFVVSVTQYKAALWLKNGKGLMRVRYFKEGVGTVMIEQQMQVENTQYGIRLTGYDPTDPETGDPVSYIPDKFYISRNEDGDWSVINIYGSGEADVASTSIQLVEGWNNQNQFLGDFNWEID